MDNWWMLGLTGVACGILSSLFGVGSGLILVPMLVLIFGFNQQVAQGTSLAVIVPMSLVGALSYRYLNGIELQLRPILWLAAGGVAGAILGSRLPGWLSAPVCQRLFAILLMFIAVRMFFGAARHTGSGATVGNLGEAISVQQEPRA